MPLTQGQVLNNRYRIVKLLGQGGFGAVYKAWDLQMSAPCAIKENLEATRKAQFESEARLLFTLRHQHLPAVHDHFIVPNMGQYLVMDFIEGEDLRQMVERAGPLPEGRAIDWMLQVCAALQYMHTRQPPVIHRDIKPDNIKITPQGEAVLVDFGVAKTLVSGAKSSSIILTPGYAPLEQYGLAKTDARTDVYALGATLYTLLTGQSPVEAPLRPVRDPLIPPRQLNPNLSQTTEQAILKAMQLDPVQRFQSAAEFAAALRHAPPQPFSPAVTAPQAPLGAAASQPRGAVQPAAPVRGRQSRSLWIALAALVFGVIFLLIANANQLWPFAPEIPTRLPTMKPAVSPTEFLAARTAESAQLTAVASQPTLLPATPTFTVQPTIPRATLTFIKQPTLPPATPTLAMQPTLLTGPPKNAWLGDTWTRPADGMVMLFIPDGYFLMGSADSDQASSPNQKPQHAVTLASYWIDQTEVTNSQYARCVADGQCQPPSSTQSNTRSSYYNNPQYTSYPVIYVSWNEAISYCEWAGGRLPTEAEWEKAARGTEGENYPWVGQLPDCNLANFYDNATGRNCVGDTNEVGSYPSGASPYGLLDMAGNVWEWVQDWYSETYYTSSPASNPTGPSTGQYRVQRGGAWVTGYRGIRASYRFWDNPGNSSDKGGVRCVR